MESNLVELILNNIADGVFTVDNKFRITSFNKAAQQITGFTADQALYKPCSKIFRTPICSQDCPLRQSLRSSRTVKNFEIDILTRSGRHQSISVCTAPLVDDRGRFIGGVETFRDISSIKELRREINSRYSYHSIISKNPKMRQIFETLPNIAQTDATVLVQGASGTGKELFASAIHNISPRSSGPLVKINCGALPENLLESELFGHVRGAFTDARSDREGRFQAAHTGTIFLDEIGDMSRPMQVKLLRVLQHHEFEPVGSEHTVSVDVRVVAATNKNLERLVEQGRFRDDLYYRLNVVLITLPSLRQRREDIPLLVDHFIKRFNNRMGRSIQFVSEEAMGKLMRYPFPGNVRELENALEYAYIVARGPHIEARDLPQFLHNSSRKEPLHVTQGGLPLARYLDPAKERQLITDCLLRHMWSIPRAARELGVHRTTLWRKVKRLEITMPEPRSGSKDGR